MDGGFEESREKKSNHTDGTEPLADVRGIGNHKVDWWYY